MDLATITAGAVHGSTTVTVSCTAANGTVVVVYRGTFWLGQGTVTANVATISVLPLAQGDIIQASVATRGNQSGVPVRVELSDELPTGWRIPATVIVDGVTMTAEEYETAYGEKPAAVYDPSLIVDVIVTDVDPTPDLTDSSNPILFDLRIEQSAGQTTVTIQNVINQKGNALVRWASNEAFGNFLTRNYTQGATVTVDVKGEDDTAYVSRTFSVGVFNPPVVDPGSSDIIAIGYRLFGGDYVRVHINSKKNCQCRLEGYDMNWQNCIFYGTDYLEATFNPVPNGTYKIWVRVAGDTNPDHWKYITLQKTG